MVVVMVSISSITTTLLALTVSNTLTSSSLFTALTLSFYAAAVFSLALSLAFSSTLSAIPALSFGST